MSMKCKRFLCAEERIVNELVGSQRTFAGNVCHLHFPLQHLLDYKWHSALVKGDVVVLDSSHDIAQALAAVAKHFVVAFGRPATHEGEHGDSVRSSSVGGQGT